MQIALFLSRKPSGSPLKLDLPFRGPCSPSISAQGRLFPLVHPQRYCSIVSLIFPKRVIIALTLTANRNRYIHPDNLKNMPLLRYTLYIVQISNVLTYLSPVSDSTTRQHLDDWADGNMYTAPILGIVLFSAENGAIRIIWSLSS